MNYMINSHYSQIIEVTQIKSDVDVMTDQQNETINKLSKQIEIMGKFVLIVDNSNVIKPSAKVRKLWVNFFNNELFARYCIGLALVCGTNPIISGAATAIFWMLETEYSKKKFIYKGEALSWAFNIVYPNRER